MQILGFGVHSRGLETWDGQRTAPQRLLCIADPLSSMHCNPEHVQKRARGYVDLV